MKIIKTLILVLFFGYNLVSAQDTLYIYRAGVVVTKRPVSEIDSVTFSKNYIIPVQQTVSDIDGNVYHTVKIGRQTWMIENLKTTKYVNGDLIGTTSSSIKDLTYEFSPKYQWAYEGNENNVVTYGRLYTWYTAADFRKIAPRGWHVSTDADWTTLQNYLIAKGFNYDGITNGNYVAKSLSATSLWLGSLNEGAIGNDLTKNNTSGFSSVPGGYRGNDGMFYRLNWVSDYWTMTENSSSEAWMRTMAYTNPDLASLISNKNYGFSIRCVKDTVSIPTIITSPVSDITNSTAVYGGNITFNGGDSIIARGVCWSTLPNPTILNSKTTEKTGSGIFTGSLKGLMIDSTYYIRAYATNSAGTAYGNQVSFIASGKTLHSVSDIDGNIYHTITIGSQIWMVENLKTTHYNDGSPISIITDGYEWTNTSTGGYSWYNNDMQTNKSTYGALYNWLTVNTSKLAPMGWHVPTHVEINTLATYLGGFSVAGSKLKESGNTHWYSENSDASNTSGFTSLPGGYRSSATGDYHNSGMWGVFWSSNDTLAKGGRYMMTSSSPVIDYNSDGKKCGFSVRCIKDASTLPVIITLPVTNITNTTALSGGKITSDGNASITVRGICWSTSANPTILKNKTTEGDSIGVFTSTLRGLMTDSTYFVRAYATNIVGTGYGEQVSFKTTNTDSLLISDMDGNVYHAVKIGTQTWMVENLRTTKYNDGSPIPLITGGYQWTNTTTAGYSWYNNDMLTNKNVYGALYNWQTVNTGKLAPLGWHVPTQAEIRTLASNLGGYSVAGSKLKESGNTHWYSENNDATNTSGFTALPGGYRSCETGDFHNSGLWGVYWSSNDTLANGGRYMMTSASPVFDFNSDRKNCGFSVRCIKDSKSLPVIITSSITAITDSTAVCGGNITSNGGDSIIGRGVCWSKSANPTIADNKTTDGAGNGIFTSLLKGLKADSTYYVRAYASNRAGNAYGEQVIFKATNSNSLTVTDIDGNVYHTITIGTQVWLKENLKVTKFSNGDLIPNVTDNSEWSALMTGGYCWYNNEIGNKTTYGALYNWYTLADSRHIAPAGWHVAADADFTLLTSYLGGESVSGNKMKETGINHWLSPNNGATNESGFTGLPGGLRNYSDGTFRNIGNNGYYWSTTQSDSIRAWDRELFYDQVNCFRYNFDSKHYGFSIRCVRDAVINLPTVLTMGVTAITDTTATIGGNITNDGGETIIVRGICWSTLASPTITNSKTTEGDNIGSFSSKLTGLFSDSTYYARAYATNIAGTAYGDQVSFNTLHKGFQIVTDIDGNVYHTVTIGTQTWMAENLKTTRFNDSISIPLVTDQTSWARLITPGYCWYNNDSVTYKNIFGAIYNWYTVNTGKLAPKGWHVASDDEWATLTTFLGDNIAGGKLKETGILNWVSPNTGATNETGFTALPGGGRGNDNGTFDFKGFIGFWWTSTVMDYTYAKFRSLGYNNSGVGKSGSGKDNGLYVRCIKD